MRTFGFRPAADTLERRTGDRRSVEKPTVLLRQTGLIASARSCRSVKGEVVEQIKVSSRLGRWCVRSSVPGTCKRMRCGASCGYQDIRPGFCQRRRAGGGPCRVARNDSCSFACRSDFNRGCFDERRRKNKQPEHPYFSHGQKLNFAPSWIFLAPVASDGPVNAPNDAEVRTAVGTSHSGVFVRFVASARTSKLIRSVK